MSLSVALLLLGASAPLYVDYWLVASDSGDEFMRFVDKSTINRRADGWTTFSYMDVVNGSHHKSFKSLRGVAWVQCAAHTYMAQSVSAYGDDGKFITDGTELPPRHSVSPGSVEEKVFAFVCGDEGSAREYPRGTNPIEVADTLYAQTGAQVAQAPRPRPVDAALTTSGRPAEYWMVSAGGNASLVTFIDKASIASSANGKQSFGMELVNNDPTGSVKRLQSRGTIDCSRRTFSQSEAMAYDKDGKVSGRTPAEREEAVKPQTAVADIFDFVCAGNEKNAMRVEAGMTTVRFAELVQQYVKERSTRPGGP
jgi:hypothetical protein